MLKITIHNEPDLATFELEGKLAGTWVDELKHCYRMLSTFPQEKSVVVDLRGVSSVDSSGRNLLAQMARDGAELVAGRPLKEYGVEEVASRNAGLGKATAARDKKAVAGRRPKIESPRRKPQLSFKNILFATDFSPSSAAALPYAEAIARHFGSKVYFAHVIPPEAYSLVLPKHRETALQQAEGYVTQRMAALLTSSNFQEIPHEVLEDRGEIWPTLSDMVDKHAVDLIVIGTHGRRGIQKMLLGSVADEIFRQATRPVLTVGPEIPPQSAAGVRLRRLLCATDLSSASAPAIDYSFLLGQEYGAHLFLLYVAQKVDEKPAQARSRLEEFSRAHMEELRRAGPKAGLEAEFLVESGSPVERILKVATGREIDLIVLGLRSSSNTHTQPLTHLPGLTAYQVVSLARCPVLTVRG
jgi:nucleotide-binding universal stress UspA family protein/ABC-type transporter Mla MlaB component